MLHTHCTDQSVKLHMNIPKENTNMYPLYTPTRRHSVQKNFYLFVRLGIERTTSGNDDKNSLISYFG